MRLADALVFIFGSTDFHIPSTSVHRHVSGYGCPFRRGSNFGGSTPGKCMENYIANDGFLYHLADMSEYVEN